MLMSRAVVSNCKLYEALVLVRNAKQGCMLVLRVHTSLIVLRYIACYQTYFIKTKFLFTKPNIVTDKFIQLSRLLPVSKSD